MKAIVNQQYGSPDVLKLKDIEKPTPKEKEVLVKIYAAAMNAADWHCMRGTPKFSRIAFGLLKPKFQILGADVAGRVEAVGKNVTQFKPGDEVFGDLFDTFGSFAEYVCANENALILKPSNISFEEAAAVPLAGITALQGLRKGKIKSGQKVLINGGSGGVGTFSVQIAKSLGANVTAVCSTSKLDKMRSIGADHVIDYTKEDFTKGTQQYDLIIDNVGNHKVSGYKHALKPDGTCVISGFTSTGLMLQHAFKGSLVSMTGKQKIGLAGTAQMNQKDLSFLAELLHAGKIKPVIDRRYALSEVPQAMRYLEEGHAGGKIVINVLKDN